MRRQPNPADTAARLRKLADTLDKIGERALELASNYHGRLRGTAYGDGRRQKGTVSDPTGTAACETIQPDYARWYDELTTGLDRITDDATDLRRLVARITAVLDRDEDPTRQAGAGFCQCCERHCSGTPADRIRSGYCPACHRAWSRAGKPNRSDFERTRRRQHA